MKKYLQILAPLALLFALLGVLATELRSSPNKEPSSTLIGKPLPIFSLPDLYSPKKYLSSQKLKGQVSLLHVWASWCESCREETKMLMKIHQYYHVPIYGVLFKDDALAAKNWLHKSGNPYILNGQDVTGDVAIDLGVYGTPETFIINANGEIIYRYIGPITQKDWDKLLWPLIKKAQSDNL